MVGAQEVQPCGDESAEIQTWNGISELARLGRTRSVLNSSVAYEEPTGRADKITNSGIGLALVRFLPLGAYKG